MENKPHKISACMVIYNEEKVIRQCLESIKNLADEIIIMHDGECTDKTVAIAKEYTDKVFVLPHVGVSEEHRVFGMNRATGDWILRIDADEFFDPADIDKIRAFITNDKVDGYIFKWEMWNGKAPVYFKGLQKFCLYRKSAFHFVGVPHQVGHVDGKTEQTDITLHHRPSYNNVVWKSFLNKNKLWVPVHAKYFFPEIVKKYECFNYLEKDWIAYVTKVRKYIFLYLLFVPIKNSLGQFKNGLWTSPIGWSVALQQYVYYVCLFWEIWKIDKSLEKI